MKRPNENDYIRGVHQIELRQAVNKYYKDLEKYVDWLELQNEEGVDTVSESLLEKYINHVGQCEGVTFISDCNGHKSRVKFTEEEIKILESLR